jgi:hypothetical protein
MNVVKEIMKFQAERQLHTQKHDWGNEAQNALEEIFEAKGWDIPKESRKRVLEPILSVSQEILKLDPLCTWHPPTEHDKVDAYCDQIVFAIGAIMKLGFDPEIALEETSLEVNSRKGEIVNGKFEKYLGAKYTRNWYTAQYSRAKVNYEKVT